MNCPVRLFALGVRTRLCLLAALCIVSVFLPGTAASRVRLDWEPSPSPAVLGYTVYCYEGTDTPFSVADAGLNTSATISNLTPGRLYTLSVRSYDLFGRQSDPSESVQVWAPAKVLVDWPQSTRLDVVGYTLYSGVVGSLANKTVIGGTSEAGVGGLIGGNTYYFFPVGYDLFGKEVQAYAMTKLTVPDDPTLLPDSLYNPAMSLSTSGGLVKTDKLTLGNWPGVYGSLGYILPEQGIALPENIVGSLLAHKSWLWEGTSTKTAALRKIEGSGRIASCYYSTTSFTIKLAIPDGKTYRVSLYFWDYQKASLEQGILILNTQTDKVISYKVLSGFANGIYWTYNLRGNVQIRVKRLKGPQAVLSGIFFDPVPTSTSTASASTVNSIEPASELTSLSTTANEAEPIVVEIVDDATLAEGELVQTAEPILDIVDETQAEETAQPLLILDEAAQGASEAVDTVLELAPEIVEPENEPADLIEAIGKHPILP